MDYISARAAGLTPYQAGEQPQNRAFIKLNTNENPYPPSPAVQQALANADITALRLYPNPSAAPLRGVIAAREGLTPAHVFAGNGSDEVLAFCFYAFFGDKKPVLFPDVTYSFYPVYCQFHGIPFEKIPLDGSYRIDPALYDRDNGGIVFPNPNAPTGILLSLAEAGAICKQNLSRGVVLIDEAYIDFGGQSAACLLEKYPNLVVVRTLSKSHSLAGLRVGYALAAPQLINTLFAVKDSFNSYVLDRLALLAGEASLTDEPYTQTVLAAIMESRALLAAALTGLGFTVLPSAANFLFCAHPRITGADLYRRLKEAGILVRHFTGPRTEGFVRITIGTPQDNNALLAEIGNILKS